MPIFVGKDYKLESMKYNIVLYCKPEIDKIKSDRMKETLKKIHGEDTKFKSDDADYVGGWVIAGYFSNIKNAFLKIVTLEIEKSDLKDVQTVVDRIDKAENNILSALFEVNKLKIDESLKSDEKTKDEPIENIDELSNG